MKDKVDNEKEESTLSEGLKVEFQVSLKNKESKLPEGEFQFHLGNEGLQYGASLSLPRFLVPTSLTHQL